jgi:hypothetical protein
MARKNLFLRPNSPSTSTALKPGFSSCTEPRSRRRLAASRHRQTHGMRNRAALWQEGTATVGRRTRPTSRRRFVPLLLAWLVAMSIVLVFAGTLTLLAALLLFLGRRSRSKTGIPSGEIFYQDLVGNPFKPKYCVRLVGASRESRIASFVPLTVLFPSSSRNQTDRRHAVECTPTT